MENENLNARNWAKPLCGRKPLIRYRHKTARTLFHKLVPVASGLARVQFIVISHVAHLAVKEGDQHV